MAILQETIKNMAGYKLHVIPTAKYKTNTIIWKMKAPITAETTTMRALLASVLENSSKNYNTTAKLRTYLDELYGATFYGDIAKKGEYHIITFTIEVANEKFLKDNSPILKNALELLSEIVTNPNVDNKEFKKAIVTTEKRILKQKIAAIADDKMRYANVRLVEEMCENEPYALNTYGDVSEIDDITEQQLYEYYEDALSNDELDLYIVGDVDENKVIDFASTYFNLPKRDAAKFSISRFETKESVNIVKEQQDVKQGKLNIGYRTNVLYGDDDYFALQLFNGLFGGFPHSKLFLNVREKASLAYYAGSRLESHKGLLIVMSGIDLKNYNQAVEIINEQFLALKNGDFTEAEIEQTKAVLKNQLLETIDNARGTTEVLYHNVVKQADLTIDEWLDKIEAVTKEDIVKVASKITQDTIYFLTGLEGNN